MEVQFLAIQPTEPAPPLVRRRWGEPLQWFGRAFHHMGASVFRSRDGVVLALQGSPDPLPEAVIRHAVFAHFDRETAIKLRDALTDAIESR